MTRLNDARRLNAHRLNAPRRCPPRPASSSRRPGNSLASGSGPYTRTPRRGADAGETHLVSSASIARPATGPIVPKRHDALAPTETRSRETDWKKRSRPRRPPPGASAGRRASPRAPGRGEKAAVPAVDHPRAGEPARRAPRARPPTPARGRSHAISAEDTTAPSTANAGLPEEAFFSPSPASASAAATPKRNRQNAGVDARSAPATNTGEPPAAGPSHGTADTATGTGAFAGDVSSAETAAAGTRRAPRRESRGRRLLRPVEFLCPPADTRPPPARRPPRRSRCRSKRRVPANKNSGHRHQRDGAPAARAGVSHAPSADETNRFATIRAGRGSNAHASATCRSPPRSTRPRPRRVDRSRRDARGRGVTSYAVSAPALRRRRCWRRCR